MQFHIYEEELRNPVDNGLKIPTHTFGILRKQLVKNLGADRAQDLLFNFGYEIGSDDGKKLIKSGVDKAELVKKGPIMHIENGQIEGIIHQCEANFDKEGTLTSIVGQGEWIGSYEAVQHLNWFGPSTKTVCHTLAGYASGFMSCAFDDNLIAKELTCKAKGDSKCTWIIKTQRQWELEAGDHYLLQSSMMIERELKDTYDQLLEQRDFIKKLSDFQKIISDELLKGHSIVEISKVAVRFLGNPICIKDKNMHTIVYAGMPEREYKYLEEEFDTYIKDNDFDNVFSTHLKVHTRPRKIETARQIRVTMPIIIKGQLLAWIFFIYDKRRHTLRQDEELFLDRFANAVSMLLLNERTKFESFERMKGNFLDQLLSNTLSEKEIFRRGLFTGINFSEPYHIIACEFKSSVYDTNNFEIKEQLLEYYFDYFHDNQINSLIGHRDGKIVVLISNYSEKDLKKIIENLIVETSKIYPNVKTQFVVSQQTTTPLDAPFAFKQASMALNLMFTKNIVFYSELGLISLLPKEHDIEWLRYVAQNELHELSNYEDEKTQELLKTLYVFLTNGGNLDKTKKMLNLSLSGLRYRLQNIENKLGKDIRNPEVMYQLTFILKLLILSEELDLGSIK